jgi:hypothetical protein
MKQDEDSVARFKLICRQLAKDADRSLSSFFNDAAAYGFTPSWLRDRYYERIRVRVEDADALTLLVLRDEVSAQAKKDANEYRKAVLAMCLACAGADKEEDATCWDRSCPLRPVSPLPYRPDSNRLP